MAFVSAQGPTVVDQTTLMKKYLQFVAALTDVNTRKRLFPHWKLQLFGSLFHKCFGLVQAVDKWGSEVCQFHFEICLGFDFWRSKMMRNTLVSRSERAVCVCNCVVVVWENCVSYNWAVIAKLIRSDCFFDQWAWCFPSWPSFALTFFCLNFRFQLMKPNWKWCRKSVRILR